jgi:hypothetical protein
MQETDTSGTQGENTEPRSEAETPDQATLHQDTYRKVMFGQAADPIFPPHPAPPEASEDELTQEAMNDPGIEDRDASKPVPTLWRALLLIIVASIALSFVFWWWR